MINPGDPRTTSDGREWVAMQETDCCLGCEAYGGDFKTGCKELPCHIHQTQTVHLIWKIKTNKQ